MSDIKWINLNPFGSHRHKAKEKKSEDLEERTVGGKTISKPISMCPQCEVLHFSIVCTSCGYRNGPNDQESDDVEVSPRTMTIAQQSQDRLEDRRTHTPPRFQPDIFLETATIPIGYNGFPGDYSPRDTPRSTPQPTPTKRLSPLRPLRVVEEHELQNMQDIDLEADGAQRPWTESSKSRSSCCKDFRGNMRRDWLGCMIVGGVILAGMITLGVLAVL